MSDGESREKHEAKNLCPYALRHALCALLVRRGAAAEESIPDRVSWFGRYSPNDARFDAFRQGLHQLGYAEGKEIVIESRNADGKLIASMSLQPS